MWGLLETDLEVYDAKQTVLGTYIWNITYLYLLLIYL